MLLSRPNLAPPSTPSNRATRYKNRSNEKSLSEAPPATKFPGERIIFDELTPIAETPYESSPPVVASPALQQPTGVELPALLQFKLPALLQFPGGVLNMQPPTVDKSPMQLCDALLSTAAGDDVYEQHNEEELVLSSDDEEVVKSTCAASQFCRDPNNDTHTTGIHKEVGEPKKVRKKVSAFCVPKKVRSEGSPFSPPFFQSWNKQAIPK